MLRINLRKLFLFYTVLVLGFTWVGQAFAARALKVLPLPEFTKDDRILVLAPHPDDEAIGTGGVIQKALKAGAKLEVMLFTNGDHNEWAFIVYEKHPVWARKQFVKMGELRRRETLGGMRSLGVSPEQVVFLGYPDFGTLEIFTKYWGDTKPYKDLLTKINRVPYAYTLSPGNAYTGENILHDLTKVIKEFQPTKIFVSHPVDFNRDHKGLYLFMQVALWDLAGEIRQPEIYPYIIHVTKWPKPKGYHPDLILTIPQKLTNTPLDWYELALDKAEVAAKYKAIKFYKSQIDYEPWYLISFARANELFADYPVVKLSKNKAHNLVWYDVGISGSEEEKEQEKGNISRLSYAADRQKLYVKMLLKRKIDAGFGQALYLMGYNKKTPFADMPKIKCLVEWTRLEIRDKNKVLKKVAGASAKFAGKNIIIEIPLDLLGNPDYILSSARSYAGDLSLGDTAWRVLAIEKR